MTNIIFNGQTDIGRVRSTNQDSICLAPKHNFFAVADGMGGHNGGDIASQMSVKLLKQYFEKIETTDDPIKTLKTSIKQVNSGIYQHAQKNEELIGMGTTIVSAFVSNNKIYMANIGDSRAYLFKNNQLFQLTKDHSLVQEKLNLGIYDGEAAKKDKQKNVLVRTVGFEEKVEPDIYQFKYQSGDVIMLCSDGLHGKVSDPDILYLLASELQNSKNTTEEELKKCVSRLIEQANNNGGNDNISVILMKIL